MDYLNRIQHYLPNALIAQSTTADGVIYIRRDTRAHNAGTTDKLIEKFKVTFAKNITSNFIITKRPSGSYCISCWDNDQEHYDALKGQLTVQLEHLLEVTKQKLAAMQPIAETGKQMVEIKRRLDDI